MYVTSGTEISGAVKALLETNPFRAKIIELEKKVTSEESTASDCKSNYDHYRQEVINSLTSLNVMEQKLKKTKREITVIKKAFEASSMENTCNFLDTEVMEKFFSACGMRFIGLSIKQNGEKATLTFVRPAKHINALPTPPMVISVHYRNKNSLLVFHEAKVWCPAKTSTGSYTHPHISGSSICMGNYWEVLHSTGGSLLLEGYQDQVLLLDSMLCTYNPDSPYRGIDEIIGSMLNGVAINTDMVTDVDNYGTFTFKNSKLNTAQNEYPTFELISEPWFKEWFKMIEEIKPSVLVDDIMARVSVLRSSCGSDDYNNLSNLHEQITDSLDVELDDPADYSYTSDEDEDGDEGLTCISEDDFYEIKNNWISSLTRYLASDECKENKSMAKNLPDLATIFLPIIVETPPTPNVMPNF